MEAECAEEARARRRRRDLGVGYVTTFMQRLMCVTYSKGGTWQIADILPIVGVTYYLLGGYS